jgi:hypothetical protein
MRGLAGIVVLLGLVIAGCGGDPAMSVQPGAAGQPSADAASSFAQFTDIPLPAGNTIDMDRTLVLGGESGWTGRLSIGVSSRVGEMYDFFRREMPKFGWTEITSARSATSFLTYQRDSRVATVQIAPARLLGSAIDITVAPRGQAAAETMPPVQAAPPRRGVDVQPAPRR